MAFLVDVLLDHLLRIFHVSQTHLVNPYQGFVTGKGAGMASGEDQKLPPDQIEPVTARSKRDLTNGQSQALCDI